MTDPVSQTKAKTSRFCNLLRAYALLSPQLIGIGICLAALLWIADELYRGAPDRTELARSNQNSVDFLIVEKQLGRIVNAKPASIALFGDSSCLMGIEPQLLGQLLRERTVASYCMIGYMGPAGYAHAMQRFLEVQRPDNIVIMLHPIQFRRDPSWESWPTFVENWTPTRTPTLPFPTAGLDYMRLNLLGRPLFEPLPGAYGLFYGGEAQFVEMIVEHDGGAIDPGLGLDQRSLAEVDALARYATPLHGDDTSYELNDAFRQALSSLREKVQYFGTERVILVIAPVPDSNFPVGGKAQRDAAGYKIAALLGLPDKQLANTPATLPVVYFSSQTHLTRWGKQHFTRTIAQTLAPLLVR